MADKKVGKLLERLAEVVEQLEARRCTEGGLDEAFDQGYDCALEEVQRFGLPHLLRNRKLRESSDSDD